MFGENFRGIQLSDVGNPEVFVEKLFSNLRTQYISGGYYKDFFRQFGLPRKQYERKYGRKYLQKTMSDMFIVVSYRVDMSAHIAFSDRIIFELVRSKVEDLEFSIRDKGLGQLLDALKEYYAFFKYDN